MTFPSITNGLGKAVLAWSEATFRNGVTYPYFPFVFLAFFPRPRHQSLYKKGALPPSDQKEGHRSFDLSLESMVFSWPCWHAVSQNDVIPGIVSSLHAPSVLSIIVPLISHPEIHTVCVLVCVMRHTFVVVVVVVLEAFHRLSTNCIINN